MAPLSKRPAYRPKRRAPARRKPTRASKWAPRTATGSEVVSALGGYALAKLKAKLGLNTETKYVDTVETNVGTSSTCGTLAYALTIPQGSGNGTRDGASCRLTSYVMRMRIIANTAAVVGTLVRVLMVRWKDSRGASITATSLLDDSTRITSQYNLGGTANAIGYTVLYDETVYINIDTTSECQKVLTFKYTPLQHHLEWTDADTTGVIGNLQDGLIRGYIMTSETGANTPNYWSDTRVEYVDN